MTSDERDIVLNHLRVTGNDLLQKIDPRLIPGPGLPLGYALKGARDSSGVAGFRIYVPDNPGQERTSPGVFGAEPDISRIIITAMRFDPKIRSAAIIRCTKPVCLLAENLFFEVATFDAAKEPPGTGTQDWGVASCCGREGVPVVIANNPAPGKPAYLRFLGESPENVATNILMLSNRVINIEIQDRSEWE
ncbi:MAG: thiamine-phosphate synthase family protein [Methanoregulaceae archaeon]